MSNKSEPARLAWLHALDVHLEAARVHEAAAAAFERRGNSTHAKQASAFAVAERAAHSRALARHPEWAP
jgi:hypothetical protein